MGSFKVYFLLIITIVLFSGCLKKPVAPVVMKDPHITYTLDETIEKIGKDLVHGLNKKRNRIDRLALTVYVELRNFSKTSQFGRLLSESLINELNHKRVNIIDYRGQTAVSINAKGEYYLSRDLRKLNKIINTNYILVGTYSKVSGGYLINSRIIDNSNGSVLTSSKVIFNTKECRLFNNCKNGNRKVRLTALKWN